MLLHQLTLPTPKPEQSGPSASETRAVKRLVNLARAMAARLDGKPENLSATSFWRHKRLFDQHGLAGLEGAPMGRPRKRARRQRAHSVTYQLHLKRKS